MTAKVKFDSDGDVIENTITGFEPNPVTELQQMVRIVKNVAFAYSDNSSRPEAEEYAKFLNDKAGFLGSVQSAAVSSYSSDYLQANTLGDAVPLAELRESEMKIVNDGNLLSEVSDKTATQIEMMGTLKVPTTPSGEQLPVIVSNEHDAFHSLDEAKEIAESLMDHIEFGERPETDETTETDETAETGDTDESGESDSNPLHDPTWIDGVGSATIEKFESNGYEIRATDEVFEHFESDRYDETASDEQQGGGMPSPDKIMELQDNGWSKDEIKEFYGE